MADHSITFKIGSVFSGDGFDKAVSTTRQATGSIRQAATAAGQMASAFGGMDTSAARAMNAVGGLAAAIAGVSFYLDDLKEKTDAAVKRMEKLKAAAAETFSSQLAKFMSETAAEVKKVSDDFERITKQANAFTAALEGVRSASAAGGVLSLHTEELQALIDANSDAERQEI